jgi:peptidoglycan/xylan/chitin deacetylase (PgdA/CDA1 family)
MIKKTLKTIIFFLIGNLLYLFFYNIMKNRNNLLYVLNYHATYPNDNKSFTKQIIFFKKHFDFVNEEFLLNKKKINRISNKPKILLTFDDGHISNLNILKILERYKIYSIFFIPYEFINRKRKKNIIEENIITNKSFNIISDVKKDNQNKYKSLSMTFSDLKNIIKKGHSIGCHGYNHIRLSDELDNSQLKKEIINSKQLLENKLKVKINSFSWIIGDYNSYSKRAAEIINKNYNLSYATCCEPLDLKKKIFQIHRFNIESYFSLNRVVFVLSGIYEIMYKKKREYINRITKK